MFTMIFFGVLHHRSVLVSATIEADWKIDDLPKQGLKSTLITEVSSTLRDYTCASLT